MRKAAARILILLAVVGSTGALVVAASQTGESPYSPIEAGDWQVSSPALQGLDPTRVAAVYAKAERLSTLYSLLIVKNGYLVAERYFNGRDVHSAESTASVTKSYVSALTGIALREGVLSSLDQRMVEFFPELASQFTDPRKHRITVRQMLQMRSGYPWEEFSPYLGSLFASSDWPPLLVEFPLSEAPGVQFGYSNLTAHILGVILARASGSSLLSFAVTHLFGPTDVEVAYWPTDANGYHYGSGDIHLTARDLAKFGQLYLDGGVYEGVQVVPAEWVRDSFRVYSTGIYGDRLASYLRDIGYGYLWWSARAGEYRFRFAWGHGGNLIVVVEELDMVVVTTADSLPGQFGEASWPKERAIIDLVGEFIASLP
jgi:CubicO group peptidase (beta-lactamase class C family)